MAEVPRVNQRAEKVFPALLLEGQRLLLRQPRQQRLDRPGFPIGPVFQRADDLVGGHRRPAPDHLHHHQFGVRDGRQSGFGRAA